MLDEDAQGLERALAELASAHRLTLMPGRTHGVHAEPLTLGVKLANHWDEVRRSRLRLREAACEVSVGNVSGAVGTHNSVTPEVEEHVCRALGLGVAPACTQVLARDRHAALVTAMALLGAVLERLATAIRLLQQTEVGEAEEPFAQRQKGSSAMPHKRNPVLCERLCGMARLLRGHALVALEDVALWHERDISHSAAERVVLPGLRVDAGRMRENTDWGGGLVFTQRLMTALIDGAGFTRERAYRTVQALALRAREGEAPFRELVRGSEEVRAVLDDAHLDEVFDASAYTRHVDETFRRLGLPVNAAPVAPRQAERPELAVEAGLGGGVT